MKHLIAALSLACLTFAASACASSPKPETPAEGPPADPAEAALRFMEESARLAELHADDCPRFGAELAALGAQDPDVLKKFDAYYGWLPADEKAALEARQRPRVTKAQQRMLRGLANCADHPDVRAAYAIVGQQL